MLKRNEYKAPSGKMVRFTDVSCVVMNTKFYSTKVINNNLSDRILLIDYNGVIKDKILDEFHGFPAAI